MDDGLHYRDDEAVLGVLRAVQAGTEFRITTTAAA
jgi:hypothetical protein